MELHPTLGERILTPISRLADIRPIVRHCHERYDGTGYPDGIAVNGSRSSRASSSSATRSTR